MKSKRKAVKMANEIKFMYNGIKVNGKLVKGFWGKGGYTNGAEFCFYADSYYSPELRELFSVRNDSDIMTDYHETEHVYFFPGDQNIEQVAAAYKKQELRRDERYLKRLEQTKAKDPIYFESYYKDEYKRVLDRIKENAA